MSVRRLITTTAGMGLLGVLLGRLTPPLSAMTAAVAHSQATADVLGADVLVLSAAGLLAWAVWAWGGAGLALTALSGVPGAVGNAARLLLHLVVPSGARRGAAVLLGLGLAVAGPVVGTAPVLGPAVAAAAVPGHGSEVSPAAVPDWPVAVPAAGPVPDWPASTAAGSGLATTSDGSHVVLRGDCLWVIATAWLGEHTGGNPTDGEVATAVHAWWTANGDVIGADPDLLLPGQVLVPPDPP
jgi:nucleoid-associated protein YgaU